MQLIHNTKLRIQVPNHACGVVCLARENVCGGLVLDVEASAYSRRGRDLPPGFMILKPQTLTDYELLDPHSPGFAQLLWVIEEKEKEEAALALQVKSQLCI